MAFGSRKLRQGGPCRHSAGDRVNDGQALQGKTAGKHADDDRGGKTGRSAEKDEAAAKRKKGGGRGWQ